MFTGIKSKSLLTSILLVSFFMLLLGCAAKKPFWGDAATGFILSYRLAPDQTWSYNSEATQDMNMEQMGQAVEIKTKSFTSYTLTGNGMNDAKNLLATIAIDSMSIHSKAMGRETDVDASPVIGKKIGLVFTSKGDELEMQGADTIKISMGMPGAGKQSVETLFKTILPDLPTIPVKVGDSWIENDTTKMKQSGLDINIKTQSTHTVEAEEKIEGKDCLKITTKSVGTLDGEGEQMGASMNFEGDIEGKGTWYFAYKEGLFVKSNSENFIEGTIAVSGAANMTIPITQETTAKVSMIIPPPPPEK